MVSPFSKLSASGQSLWLDTLSRDMIESGALERRIRKGQIRGLTSNPAIETMLYEGIPVNVTLLFSIERYTEVAWAYVHALECRLKHGKPIDSIRSVASFFVSRIDVLVDTLLSHRADIKEADLPDPDGLKGKIGVANARLAYQLFRDIIQTDRWKALETRGAQVQRVLWASTSTKNPDYHDLLYVEPLIGKQTVNTMTESTLEAFSDHGKVRGDAVEQDIQEARSLLNQLNILGIRFDCVTFQLENEGIQKFIDPYEATLDAIRDKMA